MIIDILKTIKNKIKICITTRDNCSFFLADYNVRGDLLNFTDCVDGTNQSIETSDITITTFSDNSIPFTTDIDEYNTATASDDTDQDSINFFKTHREDHIKNNLIFEDKAEICRSYLSYFNVSDANVIKTNVLTGNTVTLDRLRILGCNKVISMTRATLQENIHIRTLYFKLINQKLLEAIAEIDESIKEINDPEFKEEADIIKTDLRDDVDTFRGSIDGVSFDRLFNHWPTLLNPSPFNINV